MTIKKTLACLLIFALASAGPGMAQTEADRLTGSTSYYSPKNLLRYADFLRQRGDYARAAAEYQRYLFSDAAAQRDYVFYYLGKCQIKTTEPEQALGSFRESAWLAARASFRDSAHVAAATALLLSNDAQAFLRSAVALQSGNLSSPLKTKVVALHSLFYLREQQWDRAAEILAAETSFVTADTSTLNPLQPLRVLAERGKNLPGKSPALAGMISALMPGSGKVYAGRTFDGLFSFLLVAGTSALAYEGFHDHGAGSFKGWFFGGMAAFFYAGNVYGSIAAARLHHNDRQGRLAHEMENQVRFWIDF